MNSRCPNPDCQMACALRNGPHCVCNLIAVSGGNSPISYGLRIGLESFYGSRGMPPCVRGPVGSAYWSVGVDSENAPHAEVPAPEPAAGGKHLATAGDPAVSPTG